jgi:hypothetical protein
LSLAEPLPGKGTRLGALLDLAGQPAEFVARFRQAEERVYGDPDDPLTAWDRDRYYAAAEQAGFTAVSTETATYSGSRLIRPEDLERWLGEPSGRTERGNYARRLKLAAEEAERLRSLCQAQLAGREVDWISAYLFLVATRP